MHRAQLTRASWCTALVSPYRLEATPLLICHASACVFDHALTQPRVCAFAGYGHDACSGTAGPVASQIDALCAPLSSTSSAQPGHFCFPWLRHRSCAGSQVRAPSSNLAGTHLCTTYAHTGSACSAPLLLQARRPRRPQGWPITHVKHRLFMVVAGCVLLVVDVCLCSGHPWAEKRVVASAADVIGVVGGRYCSLG